MFINSQINIEYYMLDSTQKFLGIIDKCFLGFFKKHKQFAFQLQVFNTN